jgi:hypothetical protein
MSVLTGCATTPRAAPDEATALRVACEHAQAHPHAGSCGFRSASLKGDFWYVVAPLTCPPPGSCVGGDTTVVVSKRTGRIVKVIIGE